jgi:hypothetical protein
MAKNLPSIPAARKNDVPRCPLCGILLDVTVSATGDNSGTLTITAKSLAHVAKPHALELPAE